MSSGLQHVAPPRNLPNQPLSHFPEPLLVGPLEAAPASELVARPLHAIGWAITDDQVDRIVTYCACNPSAIQLAYADLIGRLRRTEVTPLREGPGGRRGRQPHGRTGARRARTRHAGLPRTRYHGGIIAAWH